MQNHKLVKEAELIKEIVSRESSHKLDGLEKLQIYCKDLSRLFNHFSISLTDANRALTKQNIQLWHPHLNGTILILDEQVTLVSNLMQQIGNQLQGIHRDVQSEMEAISTNNQLVWKSLAECQKDIRDMFYQPHNKSKHSTSSKSHTTQEHTEHIDSHEVSIIGNEYRKTLRNYNRFNENIPNLVKTSLGRIIKEINKIFIDSEVNEFINNKAKETIRLPPIEKMVSDAVYDRFGDTEFLKEDKFSSKRETNYFDSLDKFTDYFVSKSNNVLEDFMQIRTIILDEERQGEYFLDLLSHKIRGEVTLSPSKYQDLLSIIKYIFGMLIESCNKEQINIIVSILNISTRVTYKNLYPIKELSKYKDYWTQDEIWLSLFQAVDKQKKSKKPLNFKKMLNVIPFQSKTLQGLKAISISQITRLEKLFGYNVDEMEEERHYEIMKEVNMYLTRLELDSEFTLNILKKLSNMYSINKENVEKLVKYQYFYRRKELDRSLLGSRTSKARKQWEAEKTYNNKLTFAIQCCLRFLEIRDKPILLTEVCKKWREELTFVVYKRYLMSEEDMKIISSYRLPLYKLLVNTQNFTVEKYQQMVGEVPKTTEERDIIKMDVNRSLCWNLPLRVKLADLLVTFAYQHPQIGYLQGMNYMAQHILRLTTGPQAYKIFEHIMVNHYENVFNESFDLLKMKIYQLMRLVEYYLPRLFNHFLTEGIEGEHFLIAWAITLWGEYPGEITWVMSDGFILEGWKWWMQVSLWVFSHFQDHLLSLDFEGMMRYFSDLGQTPLFKSRLQQLPHSNKIKQQIQSFDVTNQLLEEIKKEYFISLKKLKEM